MATFNPNRVLPGTIELVRGADGNYTTKVVGLETINSLSLPEISTAAAVTKTDTDTKTATEITGDTIQSQTQQAFKTFDRDDRGPDTTGDMLQEATKLSRNLSDPAIQTMIANQEAQEQAAGIRPMSTFDADTFDDTVGTRIKDPTENVFGKSTVEDVQKKRQTTLPDLNVGKKTNRVTSADVQAGRADAPGIDFSFILGDKFKTKDTGVNIDKGRGSELGDQYRSGDFTPDTTFGTGTATSTQAEQEAAAGTLGISADPAALSTQAEQEAAALGMPDRFKGVSQEGALAGKGEKQDVKPVKRNALETVSTSLRTTKDSILSNIKTPMMMLVDAVVGPESATQKLNKSYFTDRGDGRIGGNPATDLYAGFNRVSAFGNLETAGAKRLATREKTIARKGYKEGDKFYDDTQKMKDQQRNYRKAKNERLVKEAVKKGASTMNPAEMRAATGGDGGSDSGRSKIVCTMMNESYGFGSFRNKIWMKFHGNIAPEYQKGYHKLFLPLVNYAKQKGIINKIIKNILEHIAVHSTIDMRQTLRGKRHTLGRLYRKVILPLCYWAGKK